MDLIEVERNHVDEAPMLRYDYKEFCVALGKRIKVLRKEKKITLRSLQFDHGFHLTQLQRIAKGDGISVPTLLRLAEVFEVSVETLVAGLGVVVSPEPEARSPKK